MSGFTRELMQEIIRNWLLQQCLDGQDRRIVQCRLLPRCAQGTAVSLMPSAASNIAEIVIAKRRGNGPRFLPMEGAMRKHRGLENLPSFQRHA